MLAAAADVTAVRRTADICATCSAKASDRARNLDVFAITQTTLPNGLPSLQRNHPLVAPLRGRGITVTFERSVLL